MKETHITIYIHDLEISDKSKSFLARVGLMKLDDLLNCNMTELSAIRNISEDVLQELNGVIAHSDVIISFFEERAKRIKEILPNVQDAPIESLGLGTRATNALRRGGIHTVGALIQMSQKDIFELRKTAGGRVHETAKGRQVHQIGDAVHKAEILQYLLRHIAYGDCPEAGNARGQAGLQRDGQHIQPDRKLREQLHGQKAFEGVQYRFPHIAATGGILHAALEACYHQPHGVQRPAQIREEQHDALHPAHIKELGAHAAHLGKEIAQEAHDLAV